MIPCPSFATGTGGIADALRALDCNAGVATAQAFGRLFGPDGRLLTALTVLLTLYIAFFAVGLLTGRSRLGVASLTPRMLMLGLVLTFATSWAAYHNVVWTLASGAPDQLAGIVAGTNGSATTAFADRLDALFAVVGEAADAASTPAPTTDTGITPAPTTVGGVSAGTVLWLSALMLLLGTVGVLVTAKIALAALLAIGPAFIVLALFGGTRGLFEGWLKALVLFALVPLFAVLIGGGAVAALTPVVAEIAMAGNPPAPRPVLLLFLGAAVYVALMVMVLKTATAIVSGWRLPGSRPRSGDRDTTAATTPAGAATRPMLFTPTPGNEGVGQDARIRHIVGALPAPSAANEAATVIVDDRVRSVAGASPGAAASATVGTAAGGTQDYRTQGMGSRFRPTDGAMKRGTVQ